MLGIPTSKTDMDGSMLQQVFYEEDNLSKIVDYCQKYVVITANILLKSHHLPLLKEQNITIVPS